MKAEAIFFNTIEQFFIMQALSFTISKSLLNFTATDKGANKLFFFVLFNIKPQLQYQTEWNICRL